MLKSFVPENITAASEKAVLVLADGTRYEGKAYGKLGQSLGELVFATSMTGYQETLTDPSYAGQIVLMTAPHIGNTGVNEADKESRRIWVSGFVVRDKARRVSNFRAEKSLDEELIANGVVGICGVDTRAITRHIRSLGAMKSGIFSGDAYALSPAQQFEIVTEQPDMAGRSLTAEVSTPEPYEVPAASDVPFVGTIAVLDLGVKSATINYLAEHGFRVVVLPASTTLDEITALNPDAFFYSNGPGDPAASEQQVVLLRELLRRNIPYFGICFGNQLLARALGFNTYKLAFGHRGINQPVLDTRTAKVVITSQNHGFAVDLQAGVVHESPHGLGRVQVSHVSLNDGVVEGLECLDIPAFSVQYHPEAAAGPHDACYLFNDFVELVKNHNSMLRSCADAAVEDTK
ncbi:glutamine-hydrolyzing carbamoyl-phosphate synthase small subunit [Canibacter zhuwentaonis]|uniref:glutamine-hydrolyzing carbamoyl-phosphate synthase small subunit n=1 Tax=Canibacter zhuwentaonis TaxID=2837491 RepID=UPI00350F1383